MITPREISTQGLSDTQIAALARFYYGGDARLKTLAPYIVGTWIDALLMGILLVLFLRWQTNVASTDKLWTKVLVYYLLVVCAGSTAHVYAFQSHSFVSGFGSYRDLVAPEWARAAFVFHAALRVPCSAFFTHRAWMMYKKHWAVLALVTPFVVGYGTCSLFVTAYYQWVPLPIMARKFVWSMASCELFADLSLTTLLTVALLRSKTGWQQTDRMIGRIITTLVETQTPPTIWYVVSFIFLCDSLLTIGFVIVTARWGDTSIMAYFQGAPKVYPICLMVVISSRIELARGIKSGMSYPSNTIQHSSLAPATRSRNAPGEAPESGSLMQTDAANPSIQPKHEDLATAPADPTASDANLLERGDEYPPFSRSWT